MFLVKYYFSIRKTEKENCIAAVAASCLQTKNLKFLLWLIGWLADLVDGSQNRRNVNAFFKSLSTFLTCVL